jgi:YVTN family beta-propeller protein
MHSFIHTTRRLLAARCIAPLAAAAFALLPWVAFAQGAENRPSTGKTVKVPAGVYELVVSPSTGTVYVASAGSRTQPGGIVLALDGNSLDVKARIAMGETAPYGIGINDRTQTLYTTNTRAGSVSAIDLRTGKVIASIKSEVDTSAHLREVIVDETANVVYASSYGREGIIWVIDGRTNTLSLIQGVGNGSSGLALDAAGKRLYVTNMSANEIAVIDLATKQVMQRYAAGGERPSNAAFDPKTSRLFVANQGTNNVTVLDARSGKLLGAVPSGAGTLDVEVNSGTGLGYAANRGAGTVTVFDLTSLAVVANLQTGSAPNTLTVDTKSGLVYVTNKARPAARGGGRGQNAGAAPATPPAPPAEDPNGDTVAIIRP